MTREIDLECWVCGERFVGEEPRSYAVLGRGSDLCPKPLDQNPLPLMLHTCPTCGFTGDGRAFHASQADEQVREWVLAGGLARAAEQVPDSGYARYELAALCHGRRRRVSALQLAEYYLAASWSAQLELRRRLGEFEAALQLFDEAAIQFTQHGGPTWLLRALGQQAGLAKEGSADPAPLASSG